MPPSLLTRNAFCCRVVLVFWTEHPRRLYYFPRVQINKRRFGTIHNDINKFRLPPSCWKGKQSFSPFSSSFTCSSSTSPRSEPSLFDYARDPGIKQNRTGQWIICRETEQRTHKNWVRNINRYHLQPAAGRAPKMWFMLTSRAMTGTRTRTCNSSSSLGIRNHQRSS